MLTTYQQQAKLQLIAIIATIIVIAGIVVIVDHLRAEKADSSASSTQTSANNQSTSDTTSSETAGQSSPTGATNPPTSTGSGAATATTIKDGTYTASSSYFVPHGSENIQVTLTIKDGTVTDSSIVNSESDRESAFYQEAFASEYKSAVVGKKISGLQIGAIAGASDTADGFNQALRQIISKAQA